MSVHVDLPLKEEIAYPPPTLCFPVKYFDRKFRHLLEKRFLAKTPKMI